MKMNKHERGIYLKERFERISTELFDSGFPEFEIGFYMLRESLSHITDNNQTGFGDLEIKNHPNEVCYNGKPDALLSKLKHLEETSKETFVDVLNLYNNHAEELHEEKLKYDRRRI